MLSKGAIAASFSSAVTCASSDIISKHGSSAYMTKSYAAGSIVPRRRIIAAGIHRDRSNAREWEVCPLVSDCRFCQGPGVTWPQLLSPRSLEHFHAGAPLSGAGSECCYSNRVLKARFLRDARRNVETNRVGLRR